MKKKQLALLLAAAMTVTSIDSTAMMVSASDFASEEVQEQSLEFTDEEPAEAAVDAGTESEDGEAFSDASSGDESIEIAEEPEEDTEQDEAEINIQEDEEAPAEDVFSSEGDIALTDDSDDDLDEEDPDDEAGPGESAETAIELNLDEEYETDIDEEGKAVWYKFTPEEDGIYLFYSTGEYDTYAGMYVDPDEGEYTWDDDRGEGYNFCVSSTLEKGRTYYYRARMLGDETGTFTVKLEKAPELEAITASDVLTEGVAGTPFYTSADLSFVYGEDDVRNFTFHYGDYSGSDINATNGETVNIVLEDSEGYEYGAGSYLSEGIYTMKFVCGDKESDPYEVQIKDIEKSSFLQGNLTLNEETEVQTPLRKPAFYKFKASEEGRYYLVNSDSRYDVYRRSEEDIEGLGSGNPWDQSKDETVYIAFYGGGAYDMDDDSRAETTKVTVKQQSNIVSMSYEAESDTGIAGLDYLSRYASVPGYLTLTYADNTIEKITPKFADYIYDSQNHAIYSKTYLLKDGKETAVDWSELEDELLPAGDYRVYFSLNDKDYDTSESTVETSMDFTVKPFDYESLPELTTGDQELATGSVMPKWYRFNPEKSGYYNFKWMTAAGENLNNLDRRWYRYEDGELDSDVYDWGIQNADKKVESGDQYIVGLVSSENSTVRLNITKEAEANDIEIVSYSPNPMTFVAGLERVNFDKFKVNLLYDDGSKKSIARGYGNTSDGYLDTRIVGNVDGEETTYYSWDYVPAGEYKYVFSYNGVDLGSVPVTVTDPETQVAATIENGKTASAPNNGGKVIYKFVPQESGRYELAFNTNVEDIELTDAEGNKIYSDDEAYTQNIYVTLEAGTTYYLGLEAEKRYQEIEVTSKLLATPVKLKTEALQKNYIQDIDNSSSIQVVTTITYSDGTTERVAGDTTRDGRYVKYHAIDNGTEYNFDNDYEIRLTAGEWEIVPYLTDKYYSEDDDDMDEYSIDGEADSDLPEIESAKITVEKLDISSLPALTTGKEKAVEATPRTFYRFTAEKDAIYELGSTGMVDCGIYYHNVDEDEDYLDNYGNTAELREGEECVVVVRAYTDSTITVSEKKEEPVDPDDKPSLDPTTEDFILSDGMEKKVTEANAGDVVSAHFTPNQDGYYKIKTGDYKGQYDDGDYYVTIDLYCDGEVIGDDYNDMQVKLEKGKTYTFQFTFRDNMEDGDNKAAGSFTMSFNKMIVREISKIEAVVADGYKASDCTVFNSIGDFYNTKVTYKDNGKSEIFEGTWGSDEAGNRWDFVDKEDSTTSYDAKSVRHEVYYEFSNNITGTEGKSATQTIYTSGLASFDELKLNTQVTPFANGNESKYYRFTAPETGSYLMENSFVGSYTAGNEVYAVDGAYNENRWVIEEQWQSTQYIPGGKNQVYLEKGQTYLLKLRWYYDDFDASSATFKIKKVKTLKSIKVTKAPSQKTVLPGGRDVVSLAGMEITASYTDGEDEVITYGKADSQGMYFEQDGSYTWINDKTCRVPVSMGGYCAYVDLEARSWDDVPELQLDTKEKIDDQEGSRAVRKFIPKTSGYYSFSAENGYVMLVDSRTGSDFEVEMAYLEAGVTYQVYVGRNDLGMTVKVVAGSCDWEIIEKIYETCTTDGKHVLKCRTHGDTKTIIHKAQGHEWGSWKVTKAATCADGEKQRTCENCDAVEKAAIKATKAHNFSAWKVTKKATVLAAGTQERTCDVCGKKETAAVKKLTATIALNAKGTVPLKVKQSFKVNVTMGAGDKVKSWKSSNSKVVSVKNGTIKGLKAGKTATITVQLASGKSASFKVKVQKAAVATKSIKVTNAATGKNQGKSATLKVGQSLKLAAALTPVTSADKVTWSTSNKKIATVSKTGEIKAKKKGKATITVKSGKKSYKITVNVK